ncbi:ABC transporter ATP-binding protein [Kribbella antibiotica]|uniref:ABC transporter ATP-binding protein n=1 Tax=Kribbella antibiotica TaxID=190195 RepID=A0A4R4ZX55_9ACTN|nr:ABC transporter ATP-binding protein [Kribbella antibiotica]TDD62729.1 ABC transporter ATP-binding protein [Kribbella antibiotica]
MIRVTGLTVHAGPKQLLAGIDVTIPTGSTTAIVGPNGSGKTTLLRALNGVLTPTGGRVEIDGTDIARRSRRWMAQRVAYVGQRLEPDPSLTIADEVALGALARRGPLAGGGREVDEAVAEALEVVGLADRVTARLAVLSGGELQRVAIARTLVQGAGHVLLDEPTNHLDPRHRLEIFELVRRIAPTAVVVLHDLEFATRSCDQVLVLDEGRIIAGGSPHDVLVPATLDPVYQVRTHVLRGPDDVAHFAFTLPLEGQS